MSCSQVKAELTAKIAELDQWQEGYLPLVSASKDAQLAYIRATFGAAHAHAAALRAWCAHLRDLLEA